MYRCRSIVVQQLHDDNLSGTDHDDQCSGGLVHRRRGFVVQQLHDDNLPDPEHQRNCCSIVM